MARAPAIAIVGRGRLGRTVAGQLRNAGWSVDVVARGQPIPPCPLTWLLVPDRAVEAVARSVPPGGVVLHASGSLDVAPLRPHASAGVLHPIMTFPGDTTPPVVPATFTGDAAAWAAAEPLAQALGWHVTRFDGDRLLYHAACVVAGDYATVVFHEACRILALAGIDPADTAPLLGPLAATSLDHAISLGAAAALTGPVARGDTIVADAHQHALSEVDPDLAEVYRILRLSAERLHRGTPPS